jgi:hypothetical protein
MKIIGLLLALAALPVQARQSQAQAQVQTPQQTQQAQEARQQAEAYLRKEEAAATGRQNQSTDRANQDAGVADETAGHSDAARPARSTNPNSGANAMPPSTRPSGGAQGPSYGPVLNPRQPQAADPTRKDPAEVHDETDSLTRQPARTQPAPAQKPTQKPTQKQMQQAQRRHPAWQAAGPMAPRSLNAADSGAIGTGMVAAPAGTPPAAATTSARRAPASTVAGARVPATGRP